MKMVTTEPQKVDKSTMWIVAIAKDSGKYYGALVDPKTMKCYVEEMGVGYSEDRVTGYFLKIEDEEEWRTAVQFFEKHKVFTKFLEGRNWLFAKHNGKPLISKETWEKIM